jgi:DNA polymerase-3 subunit alpha
MEKDPKGHTLLSIAQALEGLPRHASTHAAGLVISNDPLVRHLPLYKGSNGEVVTQYDMKAVEKVGLIKFDFLGLRTLTVIQKTRELIQRTQETPLDMRTLPLDDPETFRLLCAGDTTGVFQLESSGMKDLLVKLRPENFMDLIALVALYRPGPLESGMVDNFVKRKHGEIPVEYQHPELEGILKETYGIMVYQEQVMNIAVRLGSFSMGEADILRRAMGKKIPEVMARQRERFVEGAKKQGVDLKTAEEIFSLMEKFAGYGFNKSHSAAYALIAYQTAYLKAHFPVAFLAALLTSEQGDTAKVIKYISECRDKGIIILPPDLNASESDFTVDGHKIRFGLGAVKNLGSGAIEAILEAREEGPFISLADFAFRVDGRRVNRRVIESLIKCGAFDVLGVRRSQLMAQLEVALEQAQRIKKDGERGQISLFARSPSKPEMPDLPLPDLPDWPEIQRLEFEKETIGFYITGHPLANYIEDIKRLSNTDTSQIAALQEGETARLGGMVTTLKEITTKRGEPMAFATLEDLHGCIEVIAFPEIYRRSIETLKSGQPILVSGSQSRDEKGVKIIAQEILPLSQAREDLVSRVRLILDEPTLSLEKLKAIHETILRYPGRSPLELRFRIPEKTLTLIQPDAAFWVKPGPELAREVEKILGPGALELIY